MKIEAKPKNVSIQKFAWLFRGGMKIDPWRKICKYAAIWGFYLPSLHRVYHGVRQDVYPLKDLSMGY